MKNKNKYQYRGLLLLTGWFISLLTGVAQAGPFEIAVSPSRFEVTANNNQRLGQSFDIHNVGSQATEVSVRTLDWTYSEDGKISYYDELRPQSCRPWVTLERSTVKIAARNKKAFRFQVNVPANAPQTECRFMLAIEGVEPAYKPAISSSGASLSLPVTGRIAIAVYVALNGAEPKIAISQLAVKNMQGQRIPVVTVTNSGTAHGRLDGGLDVVDARGKSIQLIPEGSPILPGQTRTLGLFPKAAGKEKTVLAYPLKSSGNIDWDLGSFRVEAEFK